MYCYNYADKFLHLYIETHVSKKNYSIMEELSASFGAQYGVNFFSEQSLILGETDYSFSFFEQSERQTSVSTV